MVSPWTTNAWDEEL